MLGLGCYNGIRRNGITRNGAESYRTKQFDNVTVSVRAYAEKDSVQSISSDVARGGNLDGAQIGAIAAKMGVIRRQHCNRLLVTLWRQNCSLPRHR